VTVLRLEPLQSLDAEVYWRLYVAGRSDLPTRSVSAHVERYLALPKEEQRTHYVIRKEEAMIGTVRLLPDTITGFSIDPAHGDDVRPAIIRALDLLRSGGAGAVTASFDEAYEPDFEAVGFHRVFARMRMEAPTQRSPPGEVSLKPPEEAEVPRLAQFFMDVYEGHLEQQYGMHVGSEEDWSGYISGILRGEAGRFMPDASLVSLDGGQLAGAILVCHWMGSPLVAELGVAPDHRRRGIARALAAAASSRLATLEEPRWALYVTMGNEPAIELYRGLGFTQAGGQTVTARLAAPTD
jgi:ribosomal protein S18 acetylase RimI-like enzyme